MKKEIANNRYYIIEVDEVINRMYVAFKGEWKEPSQVPNLISDHEILLRRLKPGFTALVDLSEMKPPDKKVLEVLTRAAGMLEQADMKKQAQIIDKASMELARESRGAVRDVGSDDKMIQFSDPGEAERWLDL
jgi:hypothetical protein